jgi:hypothetical protein
MELGPQQGEIDKICRAIGNVLDTLNPIRNNASIAHPNEQLLGLNEAIFVVNSAHTILHYLNSKIATST